jgi:hypothetical protein
MATSTGSADAPPPDPAVLAICPDKRAVARQTLLDRFDGGSLIEPKAATGEE